MSPLRILQVCSSLAWGGTEMHVPIVASKLQERGHRVLAVCHPDGFICKDTQKRNIPTVSLELGAYVNPLETARLIRLLRREQPDILHLHLSRDLWQVVPAVKWTGAGRVVLTKHVGSYIDKHDPLHRWLYQRVDKVITVSDTLRRNVLDTCPITSDRVTTIHHALDLKKYRPEAYDPGPVRQEIGVSESDLLVGSVGRISPGKGYETFLKMAKRIVQTEGFEQSKFMIVGSASFGEEAYFDSVVNFSKTLGLEPNVIFTGYRQDIPDLLRAMDVFIFPSQAEGLGATLIEAMAMGVPCVSTNSDGTRDIIENQVSGFTVAPDNDQAMADATMELLQNEGARSRIASAGRMRVREKFDLEVMMDKIDQVYEESRKRDG